MKHIIFAVVLFALFVSPACATYYAEGTHLLELDGGPMEGDTYPNDDNFTGPLDIGFEFPFYGTNHTVFNVTTNGIVSFDGANNEYGNTGLPAGSYDFPAAFVFWDDLVPSDGYLLYKTIAAGEYGNPYGIDVLVVQWTNYGFYGSDLVMGTFQVHLIADGNITFNYNSLVSPERSYGQNATIGIQQNGSGNYAEHSFGTDGAEVDAGIRSGYAISFAYDDGVNYTKSEASTEGFWDILLYKTGSVAPPSKPSNPSPVVGAITSTSPTLSWSADNATNYTIRVARDAALTDLFSTNITTDISLHVSGLSENTTYYWHVIARNDGGETHSDLWSFITGSVPAASFIANVTSGTAPLTVSLTDNSTNTPTAWAWDFGDGNTSTEQNPTHTYTNAGNYTVILTATNLAGSNTSTVVDYITVTEPFVATTVNASYTSVTYDENDNMTVDPGIFVNGSSTFTSAKVYIGDGYIEGEDFLRFTNTSSISGVFNPLTGILSLSGSGSAADYQEAFRNVRYENINDNPNTSDRNITFVMGGNTVYLESTGHYYESVYVESGISWTDAKAAAEARSLSGMQGYLATILTEEESLFLESKAPDNAWIGANDVAVEGEWRWVTGPENITGEGTLFYYQGNYTTLPGFYTNWNAGEPNDHGSGEDYGQILGAGNKKWNDLPNDAEVYYYLVEYGGMPDEPIPQLTATITVSIHSINDAPSMPGNFTSPLSDDSVERGSTIAVSWGESTDPENDEITYDLWYFNGTWSQIAGMLDVTNYEFTIPIDDVSEAIFKVYANDSMDSSPENNVTFNLMSIMPGSNFTADVTSGLAPLTVNFTYDPSHYPTGLVWDFGDGSNSTEQNPTYIYSTAGTYTVSLNASNLGGYNITTKTAYITAAYVPVANFTADITSGAVPLTVNFTDTSQNDPAGWFWNFGDGTNSTEQNPTHVYASVGTYTVSLNVTNVGGSNTSTQINYISAAEIPVASFTANITSGTVPLTVNFTDHSEHSPTSWFWDFGDGTSSTEQNPSHTYTSSGTFIVNLTATNIGGSNISTQIIITDVVPVASFTANATSGALPLSVAFTDQSTNATGWYWEFGDGNISTVQNPTHTYTAVGIYSVNLTAINTISGNDTLTRTAYINAAIAPVSAFIASVTSGTAPLTVSFNDNSINTPTAWAWDFGDGATSTAQNPTHTYTSAGTYTVSLNASNVGGYNISTGTAYITVGSASSGSGTRASVSPGQPPENVASTYTSVKHVMGGTTVEYDLSGTGSPVLGISFDAKDNEGIVVVKVQVLSDRPEGVSVPPGKQYQLMSIDVGSEGTISSHNADNIRINFKVSWDWIKENNIDPSTIRLTRYHDGEWQELPTGKVSDDGQFIHFVAETPGFSIFSVVGEELVLAREGANDVPLVFAEEALDVSTTSEDKKMPGFTGLMGMLFVAVACLVRRRSGL